MKKYFKFVIAAIVALVFAGTFVFLYIKSRPQPVVYDEFTPKTMDIRKTTVVTGKIEPRNEVAVKPQISGIITEILKEAGQQVTAGEVIALEVRCGSVTMPGEGFPVAISRVSGIDFPKVKICVDVSLVVLGIIACYAFFGAWQWHIVGIGTIFAMFYVGIVVKMAGRHLGWFDHVLAYKPGFRRYIYGLARFIYKRGA